MNETIKKVTYRRKWAHGLFWSWNIIFLAFVLLGFVPTVLREVITAVQSGDIPASFITYGVVLTLIPVAAVVLGATRLRKRPFRLLAFGYGVEGPLMLLLAVRFFLIRQSTPAMTMLLLVAGAGILSFLWVLLDFRIDRRGPLLAHLRLFGVTLLLVIGLYASVWVAFYALPLGAEGIGSAGEIFRGLWRELTTLDWASIQWGRVPFTVLGIILFIYSGTLFVLMPAAVSYLFVRAWWQGINHVARSYSRPRAVALSTAVVALLVFFFVRANRQPQQTAFALLESPPQTAAEAEALYAREGEIREGLLNAYLAPFRYVSAVGEVNHIRDLYEWGLNLPTERALQVQRWYEFVARPILYDTVDPEPLAADRWTNQALQNEPVQAAELYAQYFDVPINEAEQVTVLRAARSTWMIDQARNNVMAVADREIYLQRQELHVTEQDDWAEFELYEVYQNQTPQRQEVIYYFTLPETAVITGVWLGNSSDRDRRFTYHVAPRGAAQATYRQEVRRRIDPALVEQIGPSQYRLRVFPVEPQTWDWDAARRQSTRNEGPPMHLWLTWQVMGTGTEWTLPHLAEKINVYWDEDTVRMLNGAEMDVAAESWLPADLPASLPLRPATHRVDFENGQTVLISPAAAEAVVPPAGTRLAVVLDRSGSMGALADEVAAALAEMGTWATAVDLYLTASPYLGSEPARVSLADLDPEQLVYRGGQNGAELLAQFGELQPAGAAYDAIFVLTDGTGYATGAAETPAPMPDAPVWMIDLDGSFPMGYDDDTLAALQGSGGGSAGSLAAAAARFMAGRNRSDGGQIADIVDGYLWQVLSTNALPGMAEKVVTHTLDDPFVPLAARRLILGEMMARRGQLDELATLDGLHAVALEHSIITPYSSMIVLVNERQEQLLQSLSEEDDRFEREFEDMGETNQLTVTGVPEPEEWLLMGLAVLMLVWYVGQNRRRETTVA